MNPLKKLDKSKIMTSKTYILRGERNARYHEKIL